MNFVAPFINFLLECEYISKNKLFLNAISGDINAIQIVTSEIDRKQDKEFVDGSVLHKVLFTVFDYKSISFNQLVRTMLENNENINDLEDTQNIVDFIVEQEKQRNYPDFGSDYEVEKIEPTYLTPTTPSIDSTGQNPLAKYSIPIVCHVMDYTGAIR